MSECKCTFAQRAVGDGCDVCNPDLKAECDLDAAWAWFRESGCSLTEYYIGAGGSYWRCRFGPIEFCSKTRDGAVLEAWRAATGEN